MRELRTASFAGRDFRFWAYDEASIAEVPGAAAVFTSAAGSAQASWWTFQDEAEVRERHWRLEPGEVVLDVGPAFGSYALTAAAQGAAVVAFEPCLFCRSVLEANVAANPELAGLITVVPIGVHERAGWFDPDASAVLDGPTVPGALRVDSLDSLAAGMGRVDVLKLDVEGAELGALLGGGETIRRHLPRILVEEHEFKRAGIGAECEAVLRGYGYSSPTSRVRHCDVLHSFYGAPARV